MSKEPERMDKILPVERILRHGQNAHLERTQSIGEILQASGRLTAAEVQAITEEQQRFKLHFGEAAVKLKLLELSELRQALSRQFGYPYLQSADSAVDAEVVTAFQPFSAVAEQIRSLRVRLLLQQASNKRSPRSYAIASAGAGEGRSFMAANLAVVFSQLGEKTLLIDADMRQPAQHNLFGVDNRVGLSNLLLGRATLDCALQVPELSNLSILPAGSRAPNPQELLAKSAFTALLAQAAERYEAIIVDTPPVSYFADAQLVCARAGATVIVARSAQSAAKPTKAAVHALRESGAQIIGVVLNDV
jgi:receptor protein-tyrosine kinase